jgi:hypothetical protein
MSSTTGLGRGWLGRTGVLVTGDLLNGDDAAHAAWLAYHRRRAWRRPGDSASASSTASAQPATRGNGHRGCCLRVRFIDEPCYIRRQATTSAGVCLGFVAGVNLWLCPIRLMGNRLMYEQY